MILTSGMSLSGCSQRAAFRSIYPDNPVEKTLMYLRATAARLPAKATAPHSGSNRPESTNEDPTVIDISTGAFATGGARLIATPSNEPWSTKRDA